MIVPGEAAPDVVAGSVALWSHDQDGEPISEIGWMVPVSYTHLTLPTTPYV